MGRPAVAAVTALLMGAACEAPFSIPAPVKYLRLAPDSVALETGDTFALSVTATDSAGRPVSTPVDWASSAESLATVSASGVVITRLPGRVTITASAGGLIAGVPISIAPRVTGVVIEQGDLVVSVGGSVAFTTFALDAQGDHLFGRPVAWAAQDPGIVDISSNGVALVRHSGATLVIASHGALSDSVAITAIDPHFTLLRAGPADHTCGLTDASVVLCWGANDLGQLGVPALSQSATPIGSPHDPGLATVTAGATFTCGATGAGTVYCWGSSARGRLGAGVNQLSTSKPVAVADSLFLDGLTSGWNHTCGLRAIEVICWGENPGAGGSGAITWNPLIVTGAPEFASLSASVGFGCGLTVDSAAFCWGTNGAGQLGNGTIGETTVPIAVAGGLKFAQVATGFMHACGLLATGAVECWGNGEQGQLGGGDTTSHFTPVPVSGGIRFVFLAAGGARTCGLTADGSGYCWGDGVLVPTAIPGAVKFTSLTVGNAHACGLGTDARAYCWGRNNRGQLGDGTLADRPTPTLVLGQP
ncbi:MAG TPA: Ig-like domain-containing protein [Gemmatimonadales bacterium]|nr:Ig-like domain-containing protein [Gemmatimonadales bacterium]